MGIKPEKGEIFDYFLESGMTGLRRAAVWRRTSDAVLQLENKSPPGPVH